MLTQEWEIHRIKRAHYSQLPLLSSKKNTKYKRSRSYSAPKKLKNKIKIVIKIRICPSSKLHLPQLGMNMMCLLPMTIKRNSKFPSWDLTPQGHPLISLNHKETELKFKEATFKYDWSCIYILIRNLPTFANPSNHFYFDINFNF